MARVSIILMMALALVTVNRLPLINCHPHHFTDLQPSIPPSSKVLSLTSFPQSDEPYQLINLGTPTQSTYLSPCATVLTTNNCLLQIPDDPSHINIIDRNFVFAAGIIRDQCQLTVVDCAGSYSSFGLSTNFFPPASCSTVSSVCCECNGCSRNNLSTRNSCAVLFEHEKCSLCSGFRLEVAQNDNVAHMNPLVDNKVSSIYVAEGCQLLVYQEPEFRGLGAKAQGNFDALPHEWNDVISSYKCFCGTGTSLQPKMTTTMKAPPPPPPPQGTSPEPEERSEFDVETSTKYELEPNYVW